jgi:hypothetical protein
VIRFLAGVLIVGLLALWLLGKMFADLLGERQ